MFKSCFLAYLILPSSFAVASQLTPQVPPPGVSVPDFWGESDVWWHGRANFKGEVLSPTCTIAMESAYQVIDLGILPVRELQNVSFGPEKVFHIKLRNCELSNKSLRGDTYSNRQLRLSFDGLKGETPNQFAMVGLAQGIDLQIIDAKGEVAQVNETLRPVPLYGNEQNLQYSLRVAKNSQPLKAGNYYAAIKFKVNYL
ncbi:fimbrial protein [Vibrio sagamiensis]|uniref:PAP fimbrial minor pilin protein n=1 Tax=Vibrio sagamiensis NBRC 104589 TaxID=1219064 RepID=A0A511QC41_9VIBR|nr:fimbrial protein [Vibrio sagamiensis]PNQ54612.1 type 1 fimbrial protein [Vibrio agarivorans]GEM74776.1 PAP fimbrial minor pilin protein [Vibrio sagamiensis NBRC 104589]